MKKTSLFFVLALILLSLAACGDADDIHPENIEVYEVLGLNEQIYLSLGKPAGGEYVVSYKAADAGKYTVVDKELLLDEEGSVGCYILGLKEGDYSVRVECGEGSSLSRVTLKDVSVERQDRSGYAHFHREEGIGGYNNDGTVKDGARIVYVSNATKNTVTLDTGGTTYTGLADILRAKEHMAEPLIIRVLDTITANQWVDDIAAREIDPSAVSAEYAAALISTEYGENLAGLPVLVSASGTVHEYATTPDGLGPAVERSEDCYFASGIYNTILTENASDVTIEGVGTNAGFFQFGIAFLYAKSIEVRNLTFDKTPVDAVGLYAPDGTTEYGWYWIHHNTFNRGYDPSSAEPGDECIDLMDIRNVTVSYNKFDNVGKAMLVGGWEYDYHLNVTIHHNYFHEVAQRTPNSRNANIHNYNNYYYDCTDALSPRTYTYVFSEENYFIKVNYPTYNFSDEIWGVVKSWNEIYERCGDTYKVFFVKDRAEVLDAERIKYSCSPDRQTDYSAFDTDPALFYYDAENKRSDVEILHKAEQVPDVIPVYAGAGVLTKLELEDR